MKVVGIQVNVPDFQDKVREYSGIQVLSGDDTIGLSADQPFISPGDFAEFAFTIASTHKTFQTWNIQWKELEIKPSAFDKDFVVEQPSKSSRLRGQTSQNEVKCPSCLSWVQSMTTFASFWGSGGDEE
eukprot:CAMPEP_0113950910 /NCGR_PEP_ID=MMETSP1339-20121228/83167_1 /TAXON_ID=94617 /ORGANISM="Fibrocapsa japonica" /LENGTH=127 /DNA_ID=CAMNT_0000958929 /DNA_START=405 /DNA_END=788 /DNA_ORIENTATION=- /assembly_acc=CAM_ASM_000762